MAPLYGTSINGEHHEDDGHNHDAESGHVHGKKCSHGDGEHSHDHPHSHNKEHNHAHKHGDDENHDHGKDDKHDHHSHGDDETDNAGALKKLYIASFVSFFFIGAQLTGGILANSIAIMLDTAHLASDVLGFAIGIMAIKVA